ncbi:hypothetical protein MPDQ_008102 [Monascus purpureus]|uniref:DUF7728 domain-containing protein n=1 Tax=Monascus purpureus TaxID=5098 RepID=A0A507QUM9_MONPU|nr:hypothetical protein MPDQ_008102 [Monascus purpureus]
MLIRSFVLAGAALCANAFLVIPEVEGNTVAPEVDPIQILDTKQQQITLRCTECPFREVEQDGEVSWTDGFETTLSFNFTAEDGVLRANGGRIFPAPPMTITAVQRRELDGKESGPISLGHMIEVLPQTTPSEDPVLELSTVRFTVLDLDGHPVPLDTITVVLVRDPTGEIFMTSTGIEETPDRMSWRQCQGKPSCLRKLLFSRIRALLAATRARMRELGSKISGSKGCHGGPTMPHDSHHGHHADGHDHDHSRFAFPPPPAPPADGDSPSFWNGGHPGPVWAHHHHHYPTWISRAIRFVIIPAALGVLAGLTASAVGMLVGQFAVFLWRRYRRSGQDQSAVHSEQGSDSEKQALMNDELPPKYEDDRN